MAPLGIPRGVSDRRHARGHPRRGRPRRARARRRRPRPATVCVASRTSWAPSASQTPASASSPGADRSPRRSRWSIELGVVLDGFGRPMLPLDTSASFARPGRAPLRERETKTRAETTPAVASAVPGAGARDSTDSTPAKRRQKRRRRRADPPVDARAGAHRVRGGFVDDARRISAARPVRPRALAGSVFQERRERQRPPRHESRRASALRGRRRRLAPRAVPESFGVRAAEGKSIILINRRKIGFRAILRFSRRDAAKGVSHARVLRGIAGRAAGEGARSRPTRGTARPRVEKTRRRGRRAARTVTCSRRRWTRRGRCSTPSSGASATPSRARWRRDTASARKLSRRRSEPSSSAADGALRGVAAVIARTGEGRARIRRVRRRRLGGAGVGVSAFRPPVTEDPDPRGEAVDRRVPRA